MVSTIAAGMQALGALTKGMRSATNNEMFTREDNLESDLANDAWMLFLQDLADGKVANLSLARFEQETGLTVRAIGSKSRLARQLPELKRYLNAMAGMTCARQDIFGHAFKNKLDEVRLDAIRKGTFDRGVEAVDAESIVKLDEQIIYREPRSGSPTRLVRLLKREPVEPMDFGRARQIALKQRTSYYLKSNVSERVAIAIPEPTATGQVRTNEDRVELLTPSRRRQISLGELRSGTWTMLAPSECEELWHAESLHLDTEEETEFWIATGSLLPIWDKLPKRTVTVYRLETDEGERLLGRLLSDEFAERFVKRAQAMQGAGIDPDEAMDALEQGEFATLANGWALTPLKLRSGRMKIEVRMPREDALANEVSLRALGTEIDHCPLTKKPLYHLPLDPKEGRRVFKAIVGANNPVIGVSDLQRG